VTGQLHQGPWNWSGSEVTCPSSPSFLWADNIWHVKNGGIHPNVKLILNKLFCHNQQTDIFIFSSSILFLNETKQHLLFFIEQ